MLNFVSEFIVTDQNSTHIPWVEFLQALTKARVAQQSARSSRKLLNRMDCGGLTVAKNSYKRATSESALLVHFNSISAAPVTEIQC
jgi:hypothetical protein